MLYQITQIRALREKGVSDPQGSSDRKHSSIDFASFYPKELIKVDLVYCSKKK